MPPSERRVRIDITARTIWMVVLAAGVVWLWLRLWQWILLLVLAAFLAVGLEPLVAWLEQRRVTRPVGATLAVLVLAVLIGAFLYFAGSELVAQGQLLGERIGQVQQMLTSRIPPDLLPFLPQADDAGQRVGAMAAAVAQALVNGLASVGVALVLTVYLLIDGRRTFEWLVAFAPAARRPRVRRTAREARRTVAGYVRGNVVTSAIAGVVAYVFLLAFGVPAPLLLGVLTAVFDLIPVLGIFLTAIPMAVLGFTVSPAVGLATVAFNAVYNVIENYYISPKIYGSELQLSSLAVILAFGVGAELGGVMGALVALPIAAMYPAVESLWLAKRLGRDVVDDHRRIERASDE